ncbi:MAG TPA: hypothetical protein VM884_02445 [Flavisolibacter sp.]|nr:hypothetical protein [Flavisolibacter sp.]
MNSRSGLINGAWGTAINRLPEAQPYNLFICKATYNSLKNLFVVWASFKMSNPVLY